MSKIYVYVSIILMAVVTYLIRMLPLVVFRKPINNRFLKSFLYYAPYVTLSALTCPAILYCTGDVLSATIGSAVALLCALISGNLPLTAFLSCLSVFICQFFI